MIQVIPFNISKGGNVPNMCLDNVRKGFGIGNKYGSAWEAWQHTQQHADRNIPTGLDIPLYYSYTATIDGVTENYGHINVRLANGTVWSDGNIYASIDAYLANHWPKFVGWGESVNDYKIIEGGNMPSTADSDTVKRLLQNFFSPAQIQAMGGVDKVVSDNVGTETNSLIEAWANSPQNLQYKQQIASAIAGDGTGYKAYNGTQLYTKD